MSRSAGVSPRSFLIAGMSALVVGAAAVTPTAPAPSPARIEAAVELTSLASGWAGVIENLDSFSAGVEGAVNNLTTGIGLAIGNLANGVGNVYNGLTTGIKLAVENLSHGVEGAYTNLTEVINDLTNLTDGPQAAIKRVYDKAEIWPAYLANWAQFSLGLVPGLWWVAPSVAFAYNTSEPLIRAGVYSFADMVGLDLAQLARDIRDGIKTSAENAATYGRAWLQSFVPVPTLPPYPGPLPGSEAATEWALARAAAATDAPAVPRAAAAAGGVESAIKNTYNAVEPWVAWGFQLAQWGLGFVPLASYLAPGVSLGYYTTEPLVQAGVYALADVLGLNFEQIGPDIQAGLQQSAQNLVTYSLAWAQSIIPFPPRPPFPPLPGAAVVAPTVRAAAAVSAPDPVAPSADTAPAGDDKPAAAPATANTDAPAAAPVTDIAAPAGENAPAVQSAPPTAPAVPEPDTDTPSAGQAPKPTRGNHVGHRSPKADAGVAKSASAERSGRSSR